MSRSASALQAESLQSMGDDVVRRVEGLRDLFVGLPLEMGAKVGVRLLRPSERAAETENRQTLGDGGLRTAERPCEGGVLL